MVIESELSSVTLADIEILWRCCHLTVVANWTGVFHNITSRTPAP